MTDLSKKIANKGFEAEACATTRSTSRHGLSKSTRRSKRARNRAAKHQAARTAMKDES